MAASAMIFYLVSGPQAAHKGENQAPQPAIIIVCAKYGPHDCNEVDFRTQDVTGLLKAHQTKLQASTTT